MRLQILDQNAYRVLGVFTNASRKEVERNKSRFNAFLRVNQTVPAQPFDMTNMLPEVDRSLESINKAEGDIAIYTGKMANCFFWFVCVDSVDEECLRLLAENRIDQALSQWKMTDRVSSLHNMMVYRLIQGGLQEAVLLVHNILTVHFEEWLALFSILNDTSVSDVAHLFLDILYKEMPKELTALKWDSLSEEWGDYVRKKAVLPLGNRIAAMVEKCKKANADKPKERYKDGTSLYEQAKPLLSELEELLPSDDFMLQFYEDSVYGEVLNCSIDSYNAVFEGLEEGDKESYRRVAPLCGELVSRIDVSYVSPNMLKRIQENKDIISEKCQDIEKSIERATNLMIKCPECGEESSSIKSYTMMQWCVFIGMAAWWQRVTYTCCPKCMRKHILLHGFTYNILIANILWLILILPWSIILLIMSFTKGHSDAVLKMIRKN